MPSKVPVYQFKQIVAYGIVDDDDLEKVSVRRWQYHRDGYATQTIGRKKTRVYLHQVVMGGPAGKGYSWDHINRNPLDCRKENLRKIPQRLNGWGNIQNLESRLKSFGLPLSWEIPRTKPLTT